ncbi:transposase [Xanthobacter sp. KR7-225]|uniref:transposase n=1 Tax=Xanthobacter sp. KR7-225 TaxID=3156613 RepID=UPI0032B5B89A
MGPSIRRRTIRRSRFSEEQIISVLKEHEAGMKSAAECRKHGISDATLYKWKAKYGGMTASETARLRTLEEKNRRLKKLRGRADARQCGAEGSARKKLISPAARFATAKRVIDDHGSSERRACRPIGVDRSSVQHQREADGDATVRTRLRERANERRRFGGLGPSMFASWSHEDQNPAGPNL